MGRGGCVLVELRARAYCNVKVYRLTRRNGVEISRELVCRRHNMVLTSGLNQLRSAMLGTSWQLSAIGLGSSGTAVAASQTWGLSPLLVTAPTDSFNRGPLYRSILLLGEDELVGSTIREVWIAQTTTVGTAYARVVIPDLAKTSEFAYVFQFDCSWGGGCSKAAWNMIAALANSQGAYSYQLTGLLCGRGASSPSVNDTGLADPWTMTALPIASSDVTVDGRCILYFAISPDQYNGLTMAEVGLFFNIKTGTSPVTVPAMYGRALIDPSPYAIEVGKGAQIVVTISWESG